MPPSSHLLQDNLRLVFAVTAGGKAGGALDAEALQQVLQVGPAQQQALALLAMSPSSQGAGNLPCL